MLKKWGCLWAYNCHISHLCQKAVASSLLWSLHKENQTNGEDREYGKILFNQQNHSTCQNHGTCLRHVLDIVQVLEPSNSICCYNIWLAVGKGMQEMWNQVLALPELAVWAWRHHWILSPRGNKDGLSSHLPLSLFSKSFRLVILFYFVFALGMEDMGAHSTWHSTADSSAVAYIPFTSLLSLLWDTRCF